MSTQLSFLDFQNAPEPEQSDKFQKIYNETKNTPCVQTPQRYFVIKQKLTKVQDHICSIVLRKTYNLHQASCKLTIRDFMGGVYKQRQAFQGKAELLAMGLLLRKGKNEYCIDLFYDKRKK